MNNRSAAREIIVLAIPQLPKDSDRLSESDFDKVILALNRSLRDYAKKNIETVSSNLIKTKKFLTNAEIEHPDNEQHTSQIEPVLIPDTAVLKNQIDLLHEAATDLYNALELPEFISHTTNKETMSYAINLAKSYFENKEKINEIIEQAAQKRNKEKKWKLSRMVRLDRDILRVAAVELMFITDTPTEVICDEAVKIAEKYGADESKKFVNGVLRDIVELARGQVEALN